MIQRFFLMAICSLFLLNLSAQVTIGSELDPSEGNLLDLKQNNNLKENAKAGLLLPRPLYPEWKYMDTTSSGIYELSLSDLNKTSATNILNPCTIVVYILPLHSRSIV